MAPVLPRHVTGVSRNRVVLVTYGEMGSPQWGNSDNPEEENAEMDNGNAPHEEEAEVEREAEDTVEGEAAERVREVTGADGSAAARACGVTGAEGSPADLAENAKVQKCPSSPSSAYSAGVQRALQKSFVLSKLAWPHQCYQRER